jgi:hypothetical protein
MATSKKDVRAKHLQTRPRIESHLRVQMLRSYREINAQKNSSGCAISRRSRSFHRSSRM